MRATLNELAADLATGKITSSQLVEGSLARIADETGEGARAFVKVHADKARTAAKAADDLRKAGLAPSRFAGIPIAVKDLFDLSGDPTPAGSKVLAECGARRGRCARHRAPQGRRLHRCRPQQHDRIRLFRRGHQPTLRHTGQSLRPRHGPHSRRLLLGCCRFRRRWHGGCCNRLGHRRLLPHPGSALRHRRLQADRQRRSAQRRSAALLHARFHRPAGQQRRLLRQPA
jgi:hypothetical protein